ncbi:MAG TPA: hypothetical protein VG712_02040 [Gemmatimonadales bacterium]|nr:hypothetical protein [Gemmatimonadales bacterium]
MPTRRLAVSHLAAALLLSVSPLAVSPSAAQDHSTMDHAAHRAAPAATSDSAFRALQQRGAGTMGVDQYASRHRFEDLADGGRIELQMRETDSAGVARIRSHLRQTALEFRAGRFTAPAATHAMTVPGTVVMAAKKEKIDYTYRPLPQGGEILIRTTDPDALAAIREFLAFQRADHRTSP